MTIEEPIHAAPESQVLGSGDGLRIAVAFPGKYLSVTSYKRDGTPVATPVWFVTQTGRLLVETELTFGKVKRIKANPFVTIAPCTARGRLLRPAAGAHARLLDESEVKRLEPVFQRKYRVDLVFIRPVRAIQKLIRRQKEEAKAVLLEIVPD